MTHTIRQHHLHVEFNGSEAEGLALQSRLSALCNDGIFPALEKALDRCAPAEGRLSFDRLYLDAGVLSLDRLEHDLVGLVADAVEKAIREQTSTQESASADSPFHHNAQQKKESQTLVDAFIHFLETGRLPWSFHLPAGYTLETMLQASPPGAIEAGPIKQVLTNVNARKRLVNQFSAPFLDQLLELLSPDSKKQFDQVLSKFKKEKDLQSGDDVLIEKILRGLVLEKVVAGQVLRGNEEGQVFSEKELVAVLSELINDSEGLLSLRPRALSPATDRAEGQESKTRSINNTEITEGIYIDNAGMVLLHPFLPMIFEALGISKEDKILQPERALVLLHFLVTGLDCPPEYDLVLPKICCGLPLETPVETNLALTQEEKEEAEALLNAVIRHWASLGDSSPDALRGTFLCRQGKISRRDDTNWLLQVERQGFDILLDRLPWGIGLIKLPWMQETLWVEWN